MKLKRLTACVLAAVMTCAVALTGCGNSINAEDVGATLNGEEISLGFMNFMAKFQQASYDSIYVAYLGTEYWSQEMDAEGTTMEESAKKEIAERIEMMYLLEDHMENYGVEITEEDMAAIAEAAQQFMADNSKKALRQMGATEEYVKEMLRLNTIEQRMQTAIYDEADVEVTDEEAAQRTFSYIRVDAENEDANGEALDNMKEIAKAARQDFESAAEENEYSISTYSYGSDESYMDEAVIKAADALSQGDVSDVIVTDEYYYIIRLDSEFDEVATAEKKESLISQKQSDYYTEICDGYKEAAAFEINEGNWSKVRFKRLFGISMGE